MKALVFACLMFPLASLAADLEVDLTIKDHRFSPTELKVPAGKKIKLVVSNQDIVRSYRTYNAYSDAFRKQSEAYEK